MVTTLKTQIIGSYDGAMEDYLESEEVKKKSTIGISGVAHSAIELIQNYARNLMNFSALTKI